ncbi:uncharacterized protein BDV14DRAFT_203548 [Aspergillus stella-maris]|uniref:uncharacterized protein n=1 Tax=Aspergillus stella-maris TaxID=1810926 RepID=UPI003CCCC361
MRRYNEETGQQIRSTGDGGFLVRTQASWERVKYPLRESTILKLRDLLHQEKLNVILVLNVLGMWVSPPLLIALEKVESSDTDAIIMDDSDTSSDTVSKLNGLDQKMTQMSMGISDIDTGLAECKLMLQASGQDGERQAVLDWLCDEEVSLQHHETNAKSFVGGRPRVQFSGSTVELAVESLFSEYMRQYCAGNTGNLLLYFYFPFKDQNRRAAHTCLAGLLKQLCAEQQVMARVKELYNHARAATNHVPPRYDEIRNCLDAAITSMKSFKQIYIVFDALDELSNEPDDLQQTKMLSWMTEVIAREPHVHILVTSRTDSGSGEIKNTMESHPGVLKITVDEVGNRDDMRLYLTGQFHDINALKNLRHASQVNLIELLLYKADGM